MHESTLGINFSLSTPFYFIFHSITLSNTMKLPIEIIRQVLLYIDSAEDKCTCLTVCRLWYSITRPLLYKHVSLQSWDQLDQFVSTLVSAPTYGEYVRELAIGDDIAPSRYDFDSIARTCRHLEAIDFYQDHWDELNDEIFCRWSRLTRIPAIDSRRILEWIGDHSMLQHLHLVDECLTSAADVVTRISHLQHLTLESSTYQSMLLMPILNASVGRIQSLTLVHIRIKDDIVHLPPSSTNLTMMSIAFEGHLCLTPQLRHLHASSVFVKKQVRYDMDSGGLVPNLKSLSLDNITADHLEPYLIHVDPRRLKKLSFRALLLSDHPSTDNLSTIETRPTHDFISQLYHANDTTFVILSAGKNLTTLELDGVNINIKRLVYDDESLPHLQHLILSSGDDTAKAVHSSDATQSSFHPQEPFRLLTTLQVYKFLIADLVSMAQWTKQLIVHDCFCYIPPGTGLTILHHRLDTLHISNTRFTYELYGIDHKMERCSVIGIIDSVNDEQAPCNYRNITHFYHACWDGAVQRLTSEQAKLVADSHDMCRNQWKYNPFMQLQQVQEQVFRAICKCRFHFGVITIQRRHIQELCFNHKLIPITGAVVK